YFAVFFLILIVGLNLIHVKSFAMAETIMAMAKVFAIVLFCIFAIFAIFGIFTNPIGFSILVPEIAEKKAMMGVGILGSMVFAGQMLMLMFNQTPILLVNYQGSEIIGLASAETQNPEVSIPKSAKNTAYRIVGMFVIPMFLLCLIFPASKAGVASSVFADALAANGFGWLGILFTIVVLISAFSCANSGFYAGVRTIRGLAIEGLLPKFLISLNTKNAPQNAALLMAAGCCLALAGSILFGESNIFASLLSMSGITGALCWISFGVCLYIYRKKLAANGYSKADVKAPANLFFVMLLAVLVQSAGIISLAFSGDYQLPFFISSGLMIASMVIYKVCEITGRTRFVEAVHKGEKSFDELFPKRSIKGTIIVEKAFKAGTMEKVPTTGD
ncbi:MAG: amino acid permease, partial [Desulfoprunum sp.]|nr:amino acid permease [Desulfoprunum sp.]